MPRKQTLRQKIEKQLSLKKHENAFLTREFRKFGGEDQIVRALRTLVRDGQLVRLGHGVYARAMRSRLNGKTILQSPNGFIGAARQALDKLGVKWELTAAERAYNQGRSTQIPLNPAVRVKGRVTRHLHYRNSELRLER